MLNLKNELDADVGRIIPDEKVLDNFTFYKENKGVRIFFNEDNTVMVSIKNNQFYELAFMDREFCYVRHFISFMGLIHEVEERILLPGDFRDLKGILEGKVAALPYDTKKYRLKYTRWATSDSLYGDDEVSVMVGQNHHEVGDEPNDIWALHALAC